MTVPLLNSMIKIISKLLVNCLNVLLNKIIGEYQTGFIKGHSILDGIITMHETLHYIKRRMKRWFVLTPNLNKAYNIIN